MSNLNTAHLHVYPTSASGVTLTSGASDTLGAWTEIVPANTLAATVQFAGFTFQGNAINGNFELQIGVGNSGSEVAVANIINMSSGGNENLQVHMLPLAINLAIANQRIVARVRVHSGGAVNVFAMYYYLDSTATTNADTISYLPYGLTTTAIAITPNTTPWGNSAWFELDPAIASGTRVVGIVPIENSAYGGAEYEIDIGIGSIGSEAVVTTLRNNFAPTGNQGSHHTYLPAVYTISGVQRVSFRMRKTGTDASALSVYLVYLPAETIVPELDSLGCGLTTNHILAFGSHLDLVSETTVTRDGNSVGFSVFMSASDQMDINIPDYINGNYCVAIDGGDPVCADLQCALPAVTAANWRLHRFDMKQRAEQKA